MPDLNLAGLQSEFTDEEKDAAWREANEAANNDNRPLQTASPWSVSPWSGPAEPPSSPKRYVKTKDADHKMQITILKFDLLRERGQGSAEDPHQRPRSGETVIQNRMQQQAIFLKPRSGGIG